MKTLFEPLTIGRLQLKNRLIRSATFEQGSADGQGQIIVENLTKLYENLAKGGVGLIITCMMAVDKNSRILPNMIKIYDPAFIPAFQKVATEIHARDCKVMVQLSHCGVKAGYVDDGGQPLGPSDSETLPGKPARAMTTAEIAEVVANFAKAAGICKEAGADGVQIHGAHGYFVSQFLSPHFNKRQDAYGGDIQGRGRIALEICQAIRREVGPEYPVWIKINSKDLVEESITLEECIWVCGELAKTGLDAVELSGGLGGSAETVPSRRVKDESDEGSYAPEALELAGRIALPVISVGGYRTPGIIDEWLNKGEVQAIALSRPLICEPDLPNRWQRGDLEKSRCISCNQCLKFKGEFGCKAPRAEQV